MRSDLKAVAGISEVETDLDEQTCSFIVSDAVDVKELVNGLAKENNKLSEWTHVE